MSSLFVFLLLCLVGINYNAVSALFVPHSTLQWDQILKSDDTNPYTIGVLNSAKVIANNKLYIFGGWNYTQYFDFTSEFDLDTYEWSVYYNTDGFMKAWIGGHLVQKNQTHLLFLGGADSDYGPNTNVYAYNMGTHKWALEVENQGPELAFGCSVKLDNAVYLIAGSIYGGDTNATFTYDISTQTGKYLELIGEFGPREGSTCGGYNRKLYVRDGIHFSTARQYNDFYSIDLDTLEITPMTTEGQGPSPRSYASTTKYRDGLLVFSGDYIDIAFIPVHYMDLYLFNYTTEIWSKLEIAGTTAPSAREAGMFLAYGDDFFMYTGCTISSQNSYKDMWKLSTACVPGYFNAEPQRCESCHPGSYSDTYGELHCTLCPLGTYNNEFTATSCSPCLSTFTSELGATNCSHCPLYSTVPFSGGSSVNNCSCISGFYGPPGHQCTLCPTGGNCDQGDIIPLIKPGYWRELSPLAFSPCVPSRACIGGTDNICATGHEGFKCASCLTGYFYSAADGCKECPPSISSLLLFLFFLIPLLVFGLAYFSVWNHSIIPTMSISIEFIQVVALFYYLDIEFAPEAVSQFLHALSFINWNLDIFSPSCNLQTGYWTQTMLVLLAPLVYAPPLVVLWLLAKFKVFPKAQAIYKNCFNAYLLILSIAYVYICVKTIEPFRCQEDINGKFYMISVPSQECYNAEWNSHLPLLICSLIGYMLGFPSFTLYQVWKHRKNLDEAVMKYSSLFLIYSPDRWYWTAVVKCRRLVLVLAQLLTSPWSVSLSSLFVVVSFALQLQLRPFRKYRHNLMEMIVLGVWFMFLYVILLSTLYPDGADTVGTIAFVIILLTMAYCIVLIFMDYELYQRFMEVIGRRPCAKTTPRFKTTTVNSWIEPKNQRPQRLDDSRELRDSSITFHVTTELGQNF